MGTEVSLYFPACAPRPIDRTKIVEPVRKQVVSGRILLVEPNDRMRLLARSALEWKGYKVIETDSAAVALTVWPGQGRTADLLLVDVALPGPISGRELASQLCENKPGLKVLFTCESDRHANGTEILDKQGPLRKPFTPIDLLERVGHCLPQSF
jgi:CheY-like chemotaxis protein